MAAISRHLLLVSILLGLFSTVPAQDKLSAKEVFLLASPSIVQIQVKASDLKDYTGTGFFFKRSAIIATCYHVLAGAVKIEIKGAGEKHWTPKRVIADEKADIALIQVEEEDVPPALVSRSEQDVSVGDDVFVVGNPLGYLDKTLSTGIISAKRLKDKREYLQFTAAVSEGSSGSPILNTREEVIGMVQSSFEEGQSLNLGCTADALEKELDGEWVDLDKFTDKNLVDAAANLIAVHGEVTSKAAKWDNRIEEAYLRVAYLSLHSRSNRAGLMALHAGYAAYRRALTMVPERDAFSKAAVDNGYDPGPVLAAAKDLDGAVAALDDAEQKKDMSRGWVDKVLTCRNKLTEHIVEATWFDAEAYDRALSPLACASLINIDASGLAPDYRYQNSAYVLANIGSSNVRPGDRILAVGTGKGSKMVQVSNWKDVSIKFVECRGAEVLLRVARGKKRLTIPVQIKSLKPPIK